MDLLTIYFIGYILSFILLSIVIYYHSKVFTIGDCIENILLSVFSWAIIIVALIIFCINFSISFADLLKKHNIWNKKLF